MNRFVPMLSLLSACASPTMDAGPSSEIGPTSEPGDASDTPENDPDTPDNDGDDGDTDSSNGGSTDDGPVRLDSDWQIIDQYLTEDGCNMADWLESREDGTLALRGDADAFTITHNRGEETCGLTDTQTYLCEERQDEDTTVVDDFGLDALLLLTLTAEGDLSGEELVMETTIRTNCEGGDCWLVELTTGSMPCDSVLMVEAELAR